MILKQFYYSEHCIERSLLLLTKAFDPFDGAKPRLLRRGKEAPLRVNPEQAQAFRPGSRRVDFHDLIVLHVNYVNFFGKRRT